MSTERRPDGRASAAVDLALLALSDPRLIRRGQQLAQREARVTERELEVRESLREIRDERDRCDLDRYVNCGWTAILLFWSAVELCEHGQIPSAGVLVGLAIGLGLMVWRYSGRRGE